MSGEKQPTGISQDQARVLGVALRARRKALKVSMTSAAESAHISRVTWHRLEHGEPTVAMGSLLAAAGVLGLRALLTPVGEEAVPQPSLDAWLPLRIPLADYPQLRALAWHVRDPTAILMPREAFDLYQRNWRHVDAAAFSAEETALIRALAIVFGGDWPGV